MDVGVDGKGRDPERLSHHHAGGFMAHSGQCLQFLEACRHLAAVHIHQDVRQLVHIARFSFGQSELADVAKDRVLAQCGHRFRGWPGCKESRRDFVDLFIGALRTQQHRDQQGEGIAVIEWNRWFRVVLIQSIQHQGSPFTLFHDLADRVDMIAAIEQE